MAGRRRGKYSQTTRVLRLLDRLKSRDQGASVAELAGELEVSERQIRRDLAALEEAGHALESVSIEDRSGVRLSETRPAGVRLTLRERYALLAVRRMFDVLVHTPFHEDVESIYAKVVGSLPGEHQEELLRFGERFVCLPDGGTKTYRGKEDILDALFTGVIRRGCVQYRYSSRSRERSRGVLQPYALVIYRQGLYTIARPIEGSEIRETPRIYAVERFSHAEYIRKTSFTVPESFRVERFFQGAFGIYLGAEQHHHVVIDFDARARALVEARRWHPSQKMQALKNGGLRFEIDVSDVTQVAQWAIGWGPLALVRAPDELKERVAREHREAAARYR